MTGRHICVFPTKRCADIDALTFLVWFFLASHQGQGDLTAHFSWQYPKLLFSLKSCPPNSCNWKTEWNSAYIREELQQSNESTLISRQPTHFLPPAELQFTSQFISVQLPQRAAAQTHTTSSNAASTVDIIYGVKHRPTSTRCLIGLCIGTNLTYHNTGVMIQYIQILHIIHF